MSAIVAALILVAASLTLERLYLAPRSRKLRIAQQQFAFHGLRDELQWLAITGRLKTDAQLYEFLLAMLNLGIRNAATLRASQLIKLIKKTARDYSESDGDALVRQVKMYDQEIQHLVGRCFYEFGKMLVINDPLYSGWRIMSAGVKDILRKAFKSGRNIPPVLLQIFPGSAETMRTAKRYIEIGDDLCAA